MVYNIATEHNDSIHLVCDHIGSFGSMATEHNHSVHLVCDHIGSFGSMATEHNHSVHLVCICDRYGSEYNYPVEFPFCSEKSTSIHSRRTTAKVLGLSLLGCRHRALHILLT